MTSITPKPMSTERRAEIEQVILQWATTGKSKLLYAAEDLLADAAYWREAVRTADVCGYVGEHCPWCDASDMVTHLPTVHKPDCPWLLAQKED